MEWLALLCAISAVAGLAAGAGLFLLIRRRRRRPAPVIVEDEPDTAADVEPPVTPVPRVSAAEDQPTDPSADPPPPPPPPPATSARHDVVLPCESKAVTVLSAEAARLLDQDPEALPGLREQGRALSITLDNEAPVGVRVVLDPELHGAERTWWLSRWSVRLIVGTGGLVVRDLADPASDCPVEVPRGDYRVDVYTYVTSPNGPALCPGAPAPDDPQWVDFLLHLRPGPAPASDNVVPVRGVLAPTPSPPPGIPLAP